MSLIGLIVASSHDTSVVACSCRTLANVSDFVARFEVMLGRASGMAMYRSNILRVSSGLRIPNLIILIAALGSLEVGNCSGCRIRRVRIMPMILGSLLYLGRAGVEDSPVTRASGSKYIVITATLSWEGSGQDVPFSSLMTGE